MSLEIEIESFGTGQQRADALVELIDGARLSSPAGGVEILKRDRCFAAACRPRHQSAGAAHRTTAKQIVQLTYATRRHFTGKLGMMGRGDQARVDSEAALADGKVVIARDEIDATQLLDLKSATGGAEVERQPLQRDDAVAQAVEMRVLASIVASHVVDQDHGRIAAGEELLERQHLTAIAERILCQQPHLRQAVEHHALRLNALHLGFDQPNRLAQLHLPWVEYRLLAAVT